MNDLGPRGQRLWDSIAAREPEAVTPEDPRSAVALEACRAAQQLEVLNDILVRDGLMVDGRIHPALVESNRLRPLMARLIAALRLPDPQTGARPQHRGMHGVQQPTKLGPGKVSSLDRVMRSAK